MQAGWLLATLECCLECGWSLSWVLDAVCFRVKPLVGTVRFLFCHLLWLVEPWMMRIVFLVKK